MDSLLSDAASFGLVRLDFLIEPGPGERPMTFGRRDRVAENLRGLFEGQANEETQLDQFGFLLVERGQLFQSVVHGQKLVVRDALRDLDVHHVQAFLIAAVTPRELAAGVVYEDTTHRFRGGGEEMVPTPILAVRLTDQLQPRLMHQGGGLERVAGGFVGHLVRRQSAQFLINQRQQLIRSFGVTLLDGFENTRDVGHALQSSPETTADNWNRAMRT